MPTGLLIREQIRRARMPDEVAKLVSIFSSLREAADKRVSALRPPLQTLAPSVYLFSARRAAWARSSPVQRIHHVTIQRSVHFGGCCAGPIPGVPDGRWKADQESVPCQKPAGAAHQNSAIPCHRLLVQTHRNMKLTCRWQLAAGASQSAE